MPMVRVMYYEDDLAFAVSPSARIRKHHTPDKMARLRDMRRRRMSAAGFRPSGWNLPGSIGVQRNGRHRFGGNLSADNRYSTVDSVGKSEI